MRKQHRVFRLTLIWLAASLCPLVVVAEVSDADRITAQSDAVGGLIAPQIVRVAALPPAKENSVGDQLLEVAPDIGESLAPLALEAAADSELSPLSAPAAVDPEDGLPLAPLSSQQEALRERVRNVLGRYYFRRLNTRDHTPWEMMHAIIAYGDATEILHGGSRTRTTPAIPYVCHNGACKGLTLLFNDRGRINARKGPYVQGHYAQLLAILAQCEVPLAQPLTVGDRQYTLGDLMETEKWTCDNGMELTFKLISFAHYCDTDITWKNFRGDTWSLPRIIHDEIASPILSNAACGGTHRLTGLAYAVRNRRREGKSIDGEWARAEKYLNDYHHYTLALQNSDGSFSTEWFRRREAKNDLDRRLQTTGHILEWLVYSLPADQLDHPQVVRAVHYLSSILAAGEQRQWEIGPLGHAIHALVIYDRRRYKPLDPPSQIAAADDSIAPSEPAPLAAEKPTSIPRVAAKRRQVESNKADTRTNRRAVDPKLNRLRAAEQPPKQSSAAEARARQWQQRRSLGAMLEQRRRQDAAKRRAAASADPIDNPAESTAPELDFRAMPENHSAPVVEPAPEFESVPARRQAPVVEAIEDSPPAADDGPQFLAPQIDE